MAIHAGTVDEQHHGARGQILNRLIELCNVGHAGQVLLSLSAQQLALDDLDDGVALRDLGEHQLAGSPQQERIFQLAAPGLPARFPPLKIARAPRTNLPAQPVPLIGRERELADVCAILRRENLQLLTLTGIGGIGKTRLALEAAAELARDFSHSVMFVPFAALADAALVLPTIAQTLGVKQGLARTLTQDLVSYLRDKQALLVLDNFEHVLDAAPAVADLLAGAPRLKLLVTSRARLNLYGEHVFTVQPLSLIDRAAEPGQDAFEQAMRSGAVRLFVQRAQMIQAGFALDRQNAPAVAEICARLDGIPLAIELAAARVELLPPPALLSRLHDRFALLTNGAADHPARQRTLRGALDWSYNLLAPDEQALFARLAVFAGGATVEAIDHVAGEGVATLDVLASLLHKSLLEQTDRDGEARFAMLETVRAYALDLLAERGEAERAWRRCADYYRAGLERIEDELAGSRQEAHLAYLAREHDNLRAVLGWALDGAGEDGARVEIALRLCGVLWRFWWIRGYLYEGRGWLGRALSRPGGAPPELRAKALYGAGVLARTQGDLPAAAALLGESLALWKALDHKPGVARAQQPGRAALQPARVRSRRGVLRRERHAPARAERHLPRRHRAQQPGEYRLQERRSRSSDRAVPRRAGTADRRFRRQADIALIKANLGELARVRKDYVAAATLLHESAAIYSGLANAEGILFCLENLVDLAVDRRQSELAARLLGAADMLYERIGAVRSPEQALDYERQVAALHGQIHNQDFAAAWSRGRSTPIDRMLAQAIDEIRLEALQKGETYGAR